jgi:hypothetical protein
MISALPLMAAVTTHLTAALTVALADKTNRLP